MRSVVNLLKIIYSGSASFLIRNKLIDGDFFPSSFLVALIFFFLFPSLTTGDALEYLAPAPRKGRVSCGGFRSEDH